MENHPHIHGSKRVREECIRISDPSILVEDQQTSRKKKTGEKNYKIEARHFKTRRWRFLLITFLRVEILSHFLFLIVILKVV